MRIIYTSQFYRGYKKLPSDIKLLAESKEKIFRKDPSSSMLKTHKLHGQFKEFWSFSINSKYRIVFEFGEEGDIYFHAVGDHDVYK